MDNLTKARNFSAKAHLGQRYGPYNYTKHLNDVEAVVERFANEIGSDAAVEQIKICAQLHDTVEDTTTTRRDIDREFGTKIGDLVWAVTNESGHNRAEKHAKTYPKILKAGRRAMALKLADRIANVENCVSRNHGLFGMYAKEHQNFMKILRQNNGLEEMWNHLDKLMIDNSNLTKKNKRRK